MTQLPDKAPKQWDELTTEERRDFVLVAVRYFSRARLAADYIGTSRSSIIGAAFRAGVGFNGYANRKPSGRKSRAMSPEEKEARAKARAEAKAEKPQRAPRTSFNKFSGVRKPDRPAMPAHEAGSKEKMTVAAKEAAESKVWLRIDALPAWDKLPDAPTEPVELWQVPKNGCTWPLFRDGDEKFMFCGCQKADPLLPYCPAHVELAGGMKTTPRKRAGKPRERTYESKRNDPRILSTESLDFGAG